MQHEHTSAGVQQIKLLSIAKQAVTTSSAPTTAIATTSYSGQYRAEIGYYLLPYCCHVVTVDREGSKGGVCSRLDES